MNLDFPPQVGKDDFLPENMVYRLGLKANNDVAKKFQAVLADEVLPAIRRHSNCQEVIHNLKGAISYKGW